MTDLIQKIEGLRKEPYKYNPDDDELEADLLYESIASYNRALDQVLQLLSEHSALSTEFQTKESILHVEEGEVESISTKSNYIQVKYKNGCTSTFHHLSDILEEHYSANVERKSPWIKVSEVELLKKQLYCIRGTGNRVRLAFYCEPKSCWAMEKGFVGFDEFPLCFPIPELPKE